MSLIQKMSKIGPKDDMKEGLKLRMKHLMDLQFLSHEFDMVVSQYSEMLEDVIKTCSVQFSQFDQDRDRLEHFYMSSNSEIQRILICNSARPCPGYAECGFSVNQSVVNINIKLKQLYQ